MLPRNPSSVSFMLKCASIWVVHAGRMPWSRLIRMLVKIINENMSEGGLPSLNDRRTVSYIRIAIKYTNATPFNNILQKVQDLVRPTPPVLIISSTYRPAVTGPTKRRVAYIVVGWELGI